MEKFCEGNYIEQEFTVPFNPEQNGMAERMNRTLVEMTRCILNRSGLDKSYWCEAMMAASDIWNVLPNSVNKDSCPYDMVFKQKSHLDLLRVFGAQFYAHVTKEKRKKLDKSGVKCFFPDYAKDHEAHRLLDAENGSIVISRSVMFEEHPVSMELKNSDKRMIDIINDEVKAPIPDDDDLR